jgi:hypothetical protein
MGNSQQSNSSIGSTINYRGFVIRAGEGVARVYDGDGNFCEITTIFDSHPPPAPRNHTNSAKLWADMHIDRRRKLLGGVS